MVFASILLPLLIIYVFTRDVTLNVIKDHKLFFEISFLNFKIRLPRTKKNASTEERTKKKHPPYLALFRKVSKRLGYVEITINKISIPYSEKEFSEKSFFVPYSIYAALNTLISLVNTKAQKLDIKDNAVCISCAQSDLCLDLTFRFKLFYIFPLLFDYLIVCAKQRKKKRKKAYVGEQNG